MDTKYSYVMTPEPRMTPLGSPCAWCILRTPLGLIPRESWIESFRTMAWHDWTGSHTASLMQYECNLERERTRLLS